MTLMFNENERTEAYRVSKMHNMERAAVFVASAYYLNGQDCLRAWSELVSAGKVSAALAGTDEWDVLVGGALNAVISGHTIPKRRLRRIHLVWGAITALAIAAVIAYYEFRFYNYSR